VKRALLAMMLLVGASATIYAQEKAEEPISKDEMLVWR
jgi:hypothetical protein